MKLNSELPFNTYFEFPVSDGYDTAQDQTKS